MKKLLALLLAALMVLGLVACGGNTEPAAAPATEKEPAAAPVAEAPKTGAEAIETVADDGIDYNHMTMAELYELAKQETGTIEVYSTTTDASTAIKKMKKDYPDLNLEYISCDTDTIAAKVEMEADSGNVNADVVLVKDCSGEVYNELVMYDILDVYYPAAICENINDDMLKFGLPLYSTFNPWFYNTTMFPDGVPIESWWDIVEGYNEDTCSFTDASGKNTQYWTVYTKDITSPSYAALWAQIVLDGDALAEQYKNQYGKDLVITYNDKLQNMPGMMEFPENNAGVELFWRFSQMLLTELADGDAVATAVADSINGPTLGLASASKIDVSDEIAWVTGLSPYTALDACSYLYVANNCDNPAGARLYINYCLGGENGDQGCYQTFDKQGHWSVRSDVVYEKSGVAASEVGLVAPNFAGIYESYPSVTAYWKLWSTLGK